MDLEPIPLNRLRGPANLVREEWGRRTQGKFVGARGWTGAARVHGLQETRRDGSARRTRMPWETEKAIHGRAFTGQKAGFTGWRQTACTVAILSIRGRFLATASGPYASPHGRTYALSRITGDAGFAVQRAALGPIRAAWTAHPLRPSRVEPAPKDRATSGRLGSRWVLLLALTLRCRAPVSR